MFTHTQCTYAILRFRFISHYVLFILYHVMTFIVCKRITKTSRYHFSQWHLLRWCSWDTWSGSHLPKHRKHLPNLLIATHGLGGRAGLYNASAKVSGLVAHPVSKPRRAPRTPGAWPRAPCYEAPISSLPIRLNFRVAGRHSNTEDPHRLPVDFPRNLCRWEALDTVPCRSETLASYVGAISIQCYRGAL